MYEELIPEPGLTEVAKYIYPKFDDICVKVEPMNLNIPSIDSLGCVHYTNCGTSCTSTTKDTAMYNTQHVSVTEKSESDARREYFLDRLNSARHDRTDELREIYGLDRNFPKTPNDLIAAFKAGDFTVGLNDDCEPYEMDEPFHNLYDFLGSIIWTKVKKDRKGFDKARESLEALMPQFRDRIWAETDASKMPKIIEEFQKAKLH